ncbi:type VI secretion system baseplate subunit TssG [Pseudothauera nasutitermitis]|uniref:Type VI secretion system baseplate subunit TssG n=1 Tax=Pseudothauera nasutitermitis TaxID=2565930 RepID=A0A4S4AUX1_9RHOO|nr:type VI secretion system baseplate subunit TssG [Pseudothauera nasutitermitis]THF63708.1 type VI secretion system baseplate subunit TssG [Pseudothauera nasutitermitis]
MASAGGQPGSALKRVVGEQYARFNVFQLVRLLRQRRGGAWPVGERLRFRADLRAAFPGREVTRVLRVRPMPAFRNAGGYGRKPVRIEVHTPNYCLASELGPLPGPFLEWVREQERMGGRAMAAFFDVFNQRVHVLRHELKIGALRALDPAEPDRTRYAGQLAALMGLALPAQQAQLPLPLRAWLGLAGQLANVRRSAAVVGQVLSAHLGVAARLETLVGSWRAIEDADRLALGRRNHALGQVSLLGQRTWDARAAVRLVVDALPWDAVCALLPLRPARPGEDLPGPAHRGLVAMLRLLLDRRFDCEVYLHVDPASVPPARLAGDGPGLRLGQTARLSGRATAPLRFRVGAHEPRMEAA